MVRYSITGVQDIAQITELGVTNIKVLKHTGVMFADLTTAQISHLKALNITVEPVRNMKANITVPAPRTGEKAYTPQYLSQVAGFEDLRNITSPPLYGRGINVAIIDTGIRETHEQVNGRVAHSKNYTTDVMEDGYNHGSGVASILLAVAPQCNILNLKVMDSEGDGTTEELIEALEDCIDLWDTNPEIAPAIVNISAGAVDTGNPDDPLRVACRAALENRIILSVAAGNDGPESESITSPAVEKYVIASGSINPNTHEASNFSSRGPTREGLTKPDVVFFGENIQMASSASDTAVIGKSGTSFAAPFCTGVMVLYLEGMAVYGPLRLINGEAGSSDYEAQVSAQELIDRQLCEFCIKPEGAPSDKDDCFGYGMLYGPLVSQAITEELPSTIVGSLVGATVMIGMMGMMMKTMATPLGSK